MIPFQLGCLMSTRMWCFCLTTHPIRQGLLLLWMFYYGVFVSQLIGYARACSSYECFMVFFVSQLIRYASACSSYECFIMVFFVSKLIRYARACSSYECFIMVFLSHNSFDTPGIAPLMNVLLWCFCLTTHPIRQGLLLLWIFLLWCFCLTTHPIRQGLLLLWMFYYGVFVSQLIRYAGACSSYEFFIMVFLSHNSSDTPGLAPLMNDLLWCFCLTTHPICQGLLLLWMFYYGVFVSHLIRYARTCSSYECFILRAVRLYNKLLGQGYVRLRLKLPLRKFYGWYWDLTKQYEVPISRHSGGWPYTVTPSIYETLYHFFYLLLIWTLLPNYTFYLIVWGFHETFATGVACQQRTLTPLDTWSCPKWNLEMFFCWEHWHAIIHYTSLWPLSLTWLFTDLDIITEYKFPLGICNGCGMPTGDAYSSGHLVLSRFRTCTFFFFQKLTNKLLCVFYNIAQNYENRIY